MTATAKMNVFIYSGPEVIQSSLPLLTNTLRSLLLPNYTVQSITQHALINHPWAPTCALLVIPSFSSTTSGSELTTRVSRYVNDGGLLLAFSVGAKGRTKDVLALPASYELGSSAELGPPRFRGCGVPAYARSVRGWGRGNCDSREFRW
ncbi:biotin-protein ligase [Thelephora terrestris]|uniref:Biotin-protein ligase n=1 Tax=Thelephora terrestris TaxID=56493 RepID=A0A9P6H9H9_9AGAM|nr:biotin-protein ligase [Thelephora terrestris]